MTFKNCSIVALGFCLTVLGQARSLGAARYPDRFVWVFGWNLNRDSDVSAIDSILETAAKHGIDGAVLSAGLDDITDRPPAFFRRLQHVEDTCQRLHLELIPSMFSIGSGSALHFNPNLAEGLSVRDAPFVVHGNEARFVPDDSARIANGDFEHFKGNTFEGFDFHDQPGVVSFVDTQVRHGGRASIRFEHFTANPYGHGRISYRIKVRPHRCYRQAKALSEHLHAKAVLLKMDEIRMGGTCAACAGKDMGALLGQCITREEQIVRRHFPGARVYVWSDMLDPNFNAHGNYFLVKGSFAGSWDHVPQDLVMTVWGGQPQPRSLRFMHDHGFQILCGCYYDAANLDNVRKWITDAHALSGIRGFMYTPWEKKYGLLGGFGDLLADARPNQ